MILKKLLIKNEIFNEFPYGQDTNLQKRLINKPISGEFPIKQNLIDLSPDFGKILENKYIKEVLEKTLGYNFIHTKMVMRKIPKTDHNLYVHRDFCGGLGVSLLLDDINENEGETFFYKKSNKFPSPEYVNYKKTQYKNLIQPTIGKKGDIYFWYPDLWHGRRGNNSNKSTCILMCFFQNKKLQTDKKTYNFLNLTNIFNKIGNQPESLIKHLFYCILFFKLNNLNEKINKNSYPYTRLKNLKDNFSITDYLSHLNFFKTFKVYTVFILKNYWIEIFNKLKN